MNTHSIFTVPYSPSYPMPRNWEIQRYDVFTDGPLRYLGYTDEVTMATRSMPWVTRYFPLWNPLGWGIGITYGLAHAYHEALLKNTDSMTLRNDDPDTARKKSHIALAKTIGFHALGSWFGPALIIEGVKKITKTALTHAGKNVWQWPAIAGLASIPVMQKLLDPILERNLDRTARSLYLHVDPHVDPIA